MKESRQKLSKRDRQEAQAEKIKQLRESVADVGTMLSAIEGARNQLSASSDILAASVDEFRGQITVIKERAHWLIKELDNLHTAIERKTWPGDSR